MGIAPVQAQELCGGATYPFPYTDVAGVGAAFCPGIMEAYVTGVSKGTTPTTFSPEQHRHPRADDNLPAALARSGTRAHEPAGGAQSMVDPAEPRAMQTINVGGIPAFCAADGEYIWTSLPTGNPWSQVQANTGKVLGTWTGATHSEGVCGRRWQGLCGGQQLRPAACT